MTARIDLTDATPDVVSDACGTLRRNGATAVTGIVFTDHPDVASALQTDLNNAPECAALGVLDVLLVTGDQSRCSHGADLDCRMQQGNPLPTVPSASTLGEVMPKGQ